jgi:hypothetical protein
MPDASITPQMVDQFISAAIKQQNYTKTNHQMWACGSDFQYQNADHCELTTSAICAAHTLDATAV